MEDETIVAMDIVAALRAAGYEVVATVGTGERAIEAAEKQEPDLVLMDIHLKGAMDGIDAAEIIARRQQTPIVFLTAHGDGETVQRAQTASPYGYLVKPFDQQELRRAIAIALHRAKTDRSIRDKHRLETQFQAQGPDGMAQLAGAVVHEFNNLLTVILGRCELLLRAEGNIANHRHYVLDIRAAARKNCELTHQLLVAARESLQPQVVDLPAVVASAIHLLAPVLGERVAVRTRLDEATWPVYADPAKLHQLLVNLARNARDAMPYGGTLTIETRNVHVDANYARQ
ncbi:MAG TPA: response regulator, partial [Thermoanaerobaculia bacterium]|nr:response regulator [Thermoanaerobaculia bacterium]